MIARWLFAFAAFALLFGGLAIIHAPTEIVAIYYEALTGIFLAAGGLLALTKGEIQISPSRDRAIVRDFARGVISNDERFAGYFVLLAAASGLLMSSVHLYEAMNRPDDDHRIPTSVRSEPQQPKNVAPEISPHPPAPFRAPSAATLTSKTKR